MGKFREVFMDYGQNGTPDYPRYLWQNSVNTWQWGNKVTIALGQSSLPSEALYDFEKMTLLDDAVYTMLDIFGTIPGVDTFTDPIGAAYAVARSDVENATIYSVSAVTPLAGAAYVRGGAKALSKTEPAVVLVAKKADNADGFELIYKSVNDIQANEFHVATSIDGRQSQEFLEQTKKHLDKKAVKKQVDELAKATTDKVDATVSEGIKIAGKIFIKNLDNTIAKLKSKAKYVLDGTGIYDDVKGHHPLAKKAFEDIKEYDYKKAFSVSPKKLDEVSGVINIHHKITGQQNSLYTAWREANPNKTLEIDDMAEIEIKAMVNVGILEDIATGWVVKALENLKEQGVTAIKNIPWNGINN
ncbi:hypothetical protein [Capnocytophaga canimorsus]|nr:hypothetical protein [Capnocytophaga canimorsus]